MLATISAFITRYWAWLFIVALIVSGGYLRAIDLGTQPYWMDEGYTINAILSISETGQSVLDSGLPYNCPIYCFPTAWVADTFGHDAASYRLLAVVFGILLIPLFYIIGRGFFTVPAIGLITAFFVTFEYFQLAWSRQARWYTLFAFLFWLALYAFYRAYYHKKHRVAFILTAIVATSLAILTHGLGYLLPFIMLGWVMIDRLILRRDWSWQFIGGSFAIGVVAIIGLELIFGTSRVALLISDFTLHNVAPFYLAYYLSTYWPFIPLIGFALWRLPATWRRPTYFLSLSALAYTIPLFFLTDIVHYRYAWHLTPIIFLLSALGLYRLVTERSRVVAGMGGILAALLLSLSTLTFSPPAFYWLEADNPADGRVFPGTAGYFAYTPQPDWNQAYAYLETIRQPGEVIVSSHPHFNKIFLQEPGYWLGYNYHGLSTLPTSIRDGREYYVGAQVLGSLAELRTLTASESGYIIFDYMAADGRISDDTLTYIRRELPQVYHHRLNTYSQIWIYQF